MYLTDRSSRSGRQMIEFGSDINSPEDAKRLEQEFLAAASRFGKR